jgi:hypothetical protein
MQNLEIKFMGNTVWKLTTTYYGKTISCNSQSVSNIIDARKGKKTAIKALIKETIQKNKW